MQQYIFRRLLLIIPTLIGVTVLIFLAMRVIPGDPLKSMAGETSLYVLSDEEYEKVRKSLGLHRPLVVQYADWVFDVARGDLGYSFWRTKEPISKTLIRRAPITFQIAFVAIILSWIIGIPAGIICAMRRNSPTDYSLRLLITFLMAIPNFWLALVVLLITVVFFQWRPPFEVTYLWTDPVRNLQMTIPPGVCLGLGMGSIIARMVRATFLEVLREDYVRTARAKGLTWRQALWRHALRNAMIPVLTIIGLQLPFLLAGGIIIENVFSLPGVGRLVFQAITQRDLIVVQNVIVVLVFAVVTVTLLIDIAYSVVDPRLRRMSK